MLLLVTKCQKLKLSRTACIQFLQCWQFRAQHASCQLQPVSQQHQHQTEHSPISWQAQPCTYARHELASTSTRTFSGSSEAAAPPLTPAQAASSKEPETPLLHAIRNRMLVRFASRMIRGGPLSVAEYMQEVLTNPVSGYYMKRDVFGTGGDFTTSPEISQMFGEVLGIWCLMTWQSLGRPTALQLVELGPGRGTLMADLLRGTAAFKPFAQALQVHLVEVSPFMRREQWKKLQCSSSSSRQQTEEQPPTTGTTSLNGSTVKWHAVLDEVPTAGPAIYLAHEFLDALPVHQFVRDPQRGWLEVMVDTNDDVGQSESAGDSSSTAAKQTEYDGVPLVNAAALQQPQQQQQQSGESRASAAEGSPSTDQDLHLRYVLSPRPTPASHLLVKRRLEAISSSSGGSSSGSRQQHSIGDSSNTASHHTDAVEIGASAMAVVEGLARRIAAHGGAALLIDYGANQPYKNSLTGIRSHQGVHPLSMPGTADLSAWVDFSAMRMAAEQAFSVQPPPSASKPQAPAGQSLSSSSHGSHSKDCSSVDRKEVGTSQLPDGSSGSSSDGSSGVDVFGPVTQEHLLHSLGIQARLQALAQEVSQEQADDLLAGYNRLTDTGPGGMGASYLALAITSKGLGAPVGFEGQAPERV